MGGLGALRFVGPKNQVNNDWAQRNADALRTYLDQQERGRQEAVRDILDEIRGNSRQIASLIQSVTEVTGENRRRLETAISFQREILEAVRVLLDRQRRHE